MFNIYKCGREVQDTERGTLGVRTTHSSRIICGLCTVLCTHVASDANCKVCTLMLMNAKRIVSVRHAIDDSEPPCLFQRMKTCSVFLLEKDEFAVS